MSNWSSRSLSCSVHSLGPQSLRKTQRHTANGTLHFGCPNDRTVAGTTKQQTPSWEAERFRGVTTCRGKLYCSERLEMIDKNHPISGKVWINSSSHVESKKQHLGIYNLPFKTYKFSRIPLRQTTLGWCVPSPRPRPSRHSWRHKVMRIVAMIAMKCRFKKVQYRFSFSRRFHEVVIEILLPKTTGIIWFSTISKLQLLTYVRSEMCFACFMASKSLADRVSMFSKCKYQQRQVFDIRQKEGRWGHLSKFWCFINLQFPFLFGVMFEFPYEPTTRYWHYMILFLGRTCVLKDCFFFQICLKLLGGGLSAAPIEKTSKLVKSDHFTPRNLWIHQTCSSTFVWNRTSRDCPQLTNDFQTWTIHTFRGLDLSLKGSTLRFWTWICLFQIGFGK